jgi:hypothetical protein
MPTTKKAAPLDVRPIPWPRDSSIDGRILLVAQDFQDRGLALTKSTLCLLVGYGHEASTGFGRAWTKCSRQKWAVIVNKSVRIEQAGRDEVAERHLTAAAVDLNLVAILGPKTAELARVLSDGQVWTAQRASRAIGYSHTASSGYTKALRTLRCLGLADPKLIKLNSVALQWLDSM